MTARTHLNYITQFHRRTPASWVILIGNMLLATFLALFGPGLYALDQYLNITYPMPLTFLIGLAVAVAAVLVVLTGGRRAAQTQLRSA